MNETPSSRLFAHARALSMALGCVTLGNLEFVGHALPLPGTVYTSGSHVGAMLVVFVALPTLFLFVLDRVIFLSWGTNPLRVYRSGMLGLALFFIGRELHLYSDLVDPVTSLMTPGGGIGIGLGAALAAVAIWICYSAQKPVSMFFEYMGVVSLVLVVFVAVVWASNPSPPESYADIVTLETKTNDGPVFVLVFDELSYAVLSDDGELDRSSFPNFARLADDGAWFTNATTNYYHTRFVIPSLLASMQSLTNEYELWSYPQHAFVESLMWDGCGTSYTCRGAAYRASDNPTQLFAHSIDRWAHEVLPDSIAGIASTPAKWLLGDLNEPPPTSDPLGIHLFTEEHWAEFLGDISADGSRGRAYLFHSMLPHFPFIFDKDGDVTSSSQNTTLYNDPFSAETYENYRQQTMFADRMLGEFLERLEEEGLSEDAVVIVTGDHGLRRIDTAITDVIDVDPESVYIPLLIKAPGLAPSILDVDYQHIDFGPTLMDALGLPVEGWSPGVSALAEERPNRDKVFYTSDHDQRYWKYVYNVARSEWVVVDEVEGRLSEIALSAAQPDAGSVVH